MVFLIDHMAVMLTMWSNRRVIVVSWLLCIYLFSVGWLFKRRAVVLIVLSNGLRFSNCLFVRLVVLIVFGAFLQLS